MFAGISKDRCLCVFYVKIDDEQSYIIQRGGVWYLVIADRWFPNFRAFTWKDAVRSRLKTETDDPRVVYGWLIRLFNSYLDALRDHETHTGEGSPGGPVICLFSFPVK